jgi:hypothetical protein
MSMRDALERYIMSKIAIVAFPFVENKIEDEMFSRRMKLLSFVTPEVFYFLKKK